MRPETDAYGAAGREILELVLVVLSTAGVGHDVEAESMKGG